MRVLFATDGSPEATEALLAGSRLLADDLQADVLYVAPKLRAPKSHHERVAGETRRILESAKKTLADEGVDALTLSETGSAAGVLMREAATRDIAVIGAKGGDGRSEIGLGPVASRLVEHATGCVLVGREAPGDQGIRILVPVDGSDGAGQAMDALNAFFDVDSAEITLLHVLETLWLPVKEDEQVEDAEPESQENHQFSTELRREAEQLLAQARNRFSEHHPSIITLVREGVPGNEILSEADQGEYDLVVVGSNGATDMKHRVLGGISSKVAWNAPCSVLVVRIPE